MRLSEFEIESIKRLASRHFGEEVHVFLFGSRTNNLKRGGDIDLFISNSNCKHLKIRAKIDFITELIQLIGEQKIDVILDNKNSGDSKLFRTIYQTQIQLC